MAVRVTCKSKRHSAEPLPWTYLGPLPEYVIELDDADPTLAWLTAVREGCALQAKQASVFDGGTWPNPEGPKWSERGIAPESAHPGEVWFSIAAWNRRLPGARFELQLETMDAGFIVTWSFEIV